LSIGGFAWVAGSSTRTTRRSASLPSIWHDDGRGHFTDVTATGDIQPDNPEASRVEVTIQMASITTNHPQRDNDLRSSNFLEVDAHPTRPSRVPPSSRPEPTSSASPAI
jgi:polyisoprenoid-binding protein YceI